MTMHEHLQCSLIPGPNWKWGNQDGGAGNIGRVFAVRNGVVEVNVYHFVSLFNLLFSQFFPSVLSTTYTSYNTCGNDTYL
mgnify:CR=1 FL=1